MRMRSRTERNGKPVERPELKERRKRRRRMGKKTIDDHLVDHDCVVGHGKVRLAAKGLDAEIWIDGADAPFQTISLEPADENPAPHKTVEINGQRCTVIRDAIQNAVYLEIDGKDGERWRGKVWVDEA